MTGGGVLYLNVGMRYMTRLAVSIHSLRQHYGGPVTVMCWPQGVRDFVFTYFQALNVETRLIPLFVPRRNACYSAKPTIMRNSPYERTVFLDADTLVTGDITPLFPEGNEVVVTRFSDWVTTGRKVRGRIEGWRKVATEFVDDALSAPHPAINSGVMGFHHTSSFLTDWQSLTAKRSCFICDEIACQICYRHHPYRLLDERYNFSPIHGKATDGIVVRHHHGDRHCQDAEWRVAFLGAWNTNLCSIMSWAPADDKSLAVHMRQTGMTP